MSAFGISSIVNGCLPYADLCPLHLLPLTYTVFFGCMFLRLDSGSCRRKLQAHVQFGYILLTEDLEQSFLLGKPWFFSQDVFEPWFAMANFQYRSSVFVVTPSSL